MDKVAYVSASKHYGGCCVTVAVDGVEFINPVEVGQLVSLKSSINFVGKSSMIVGIRVEALYHKTGIVSHTNSSYFTTVAKNDLNETDIVPGLILENETDIRRFYEGLYLKLMSKQKREMLVSDFSHLSVNEIKNLLSDEKCKISI